MSTHATMEVHRRTHLHHQHQQQQQWVQCNGNACPRATAGASTAVANPETIEMTCVPTLPQDLEQHIRECQCSCDHLGFGNFKVGSDINRRLRSKIGSEMMQSFFVAWWTWLKKKTCYLCFARRLETKFRLLPDMFELVITLVWFSWK